MGAPRWRVATSASSPSSSSTPIRSARDRVLLFTLYPLDDRPPGSRRARADRPRRRRGQHDRGARARAAGRGLPGRDPRGAVRRRARHVCRAGRRGRGGAAARCASSASHSSTSPAGCRSSTPRRSTTRLPRRAPLLLEVDEPPRAAARGGRRARRADAPAPSKHSTIDVWLNGGAIARVGRDGPHSRAATACTWWTRRRTGRTRRTTTRNVAWARGVLAAARAARERGAPTSTSPASSRRGRRSSGRAWARTTSGSPRLKQRLDPENLFRRNANVEPAPGS